MNTKKKAAILTMQSLDNYGQKLQNYAVCKLLSGYGYESFSLLVQYPQSGKTRCKKILSHLLKAARPRHKALRAREKKFLQFRKAHLNPMKIKYDDRDTYNSFDLVATGSDQVWNPYIPKQELDVFFLTCVDAEKRLAMVPSMGFDALRTDQKEMYKQYLSGFANISVREETGKKEIEQITGRECARLVDPTMWIDQSHWASMRNGTYPLPSKPYAFYFMLGNCEKAECETQARQYCKEHNLEFCNLAELNKDANRVVGIEDWLTLMCHAEVVFTNSFHGAVFAILFHKELWTEQRVNSETVTETRVLQLLKLFGLEKRFSPEQYGGQEKIQWENVDLILEQERSKAFRWLSNALTFTRA